MSRKRNQRLPLWRALLGIVFAVAATGLLIYGSVMLTAKAAISERMIEETVSEIDFMKEYGEDATKAINVGIMHLTDSAYTDGLYLTQNELRSYLDDQEIKRFVIRKVSEFAAVITSDSHAALDAQELVPFFDRVRKHAEQETGLQITDAQMQAEIGKAIGADIYTLQDNQLIYPGRAVLCVILGALLLVGVYFACWPRFVLSSILCAASIVTLCIVLGGIGIGITKLFDVSEVATTFGPGAFSLWLGNVADLFSRRATLSLLGVIAPALVTVAYFVDAVHVTRLESNSRWN